MSIDVEALKDALEGKCHEDLRIIYEQQMEFTRFHNGLVWQVSSIFIPFSFAGLALNFKTEDQVLFVGGGSIAILLIWTALAEWHRWLWAHSFYIAGVIENILGVRKIPPNPPAILSFQPPQFLGMGGKGASFDFGRLLRLLFSAVGIGFWVVRMLVWETV